jgi:DNA-binding ferritin-like protein
VATSTSHRDNVFAVKLASFYVLSLERIADKTHWELYGPAFESREE